MTIPFNKPYFSGNELNYIQEAIRSSKISGDGLFTHKCHRFFEETYGFRKALLTTSCTDALEMAALLCDIRPGDEVIAPSYTFVSTVNPFVMRGATIRFVDSLPGHPNMDVEQVEPLINQNTKAIICVHYSGMACDMDRLTALCKAHDLFLIEDAAQAIGSSYKGKPLGSFGHLAAFSFHETKTIISGEGGLLVVNDERFIKRAEIIREKGTNRTAFFRGEVDKYGWVDIGSSYLPSDMISAYLYAQLENQEDIFARRKAIWQTYYEALEPCKTLVKLPVVPEHATNNGQSFYLVCKNLEERNALIRHLKNQDINAVFHYLSLHKSPYFEDKYQGPELPNSDRYSACLLRLPLFYELSLESVADISAAIGQFFEMNN
jgi:dTDP-4-amino-4,6-dideoxygalactose transaminase